MENVNETICDRSDHDYFKNKKDGDNDNDNREIVCNISQVVERTENDSAISIINQLLFKEFLNKTEQNNFTTNIIKGQELDQQLEAFGYFLGKLEIRIVGHMEQSLTDKPIFDPNILRNANDSMKNR